MTLFIIYKAKIILIKIIILKSNKPWKRVKKTSGLFYFFLDGFLKVKSAFVAPSLTVTVAV